MTNFYLQGVFKWKGTKRHNNVTVSIFAYAANEERSQITRDVIKIFIADRSMRGRPHMQERAEILIKNAL